MTLTEAINFAILNCPDKMAVTYLEALNLSIEEYGSAGLHTQILYALSNMNYWKGQDAREVKKVLRDFVKQHKTRG